MVKYMNASQVGNILYLETNHCVQGDTTHLSLIFKFFRKHFMRYQQKVKIFNKNISTLAKLFWKICKIHQQVLSKQILSKVGCYIRLS